MPLIPESQYSERKAGLSWFKVSLVYKANSRTVGELLRETLSQTHRQTNK